MLLIFLGTLTYDACMFPCLTGVLFLFISEVFVRPQTNQNLPPFLREIPSCFVAFELCLFIYLGYKPLLYMTIANMFSISYIISHFIDGSP